MKMIAAMLIALLVPVTLFAADFRVSQLQIPPEKIGDGWTTGSVGFVVDDLDSPAIPPIGVKQLNYMRERFGPQGVKAIATFQYKKEKNQDHGVTIHVRLFKTPDQCQKWVKEFYLSDGRKKRYKKVDTKEYTAYDSTDMRERVVAFDRIMITAGTITKSKDHLHILDMYVAASKKAIEQGEK